MNSLVMTGRFGSLNNFTQLLIINNTYKKKRRKSQMTRNNY